MVGLVNNKIINYNPASYNIQFVGKRAYFSFGQYTIDFEKIFLLSTLNETHLLNDWLFGPSIHRLFNVNCDYR